MVMSDGSPGSGNGVAGECHGRDSSSVAQVTYRMAGHEHDVNAGRILSATVTGTRIDDLMAVPLAALLTEPMAADEVAAAFGSAGVELSSERAATLIDRAAALGLARVADEERGHARYVATSLGRRMASAVVGVDPAIAVGLEELERLRTDLLATIGHELRTPLTAIRTSVGLLLDPGLAPSDDQRQQLLGTIGRSSDRMQRLLAELLDLARLRSGRVPMDRSDFDARELAREVAAAIEPMAAAHDQVVRLTVPDGPVPVRGDRRRLEQALLNLAANAQRFSPRGGEVAIIVAGSDGRVGWTVVDDGPGISDAEQERLFERFFVGERDRAGTGRGVGLGLPTALAIAQAHGGTIDVDSAIGRGSRFTLLVPGPASP
jgi:signal transduction histidine kinase